jgi:hypothetical protein
VGAGFEVVSPRGFSVQLGYKNLTADRISKNSGDLKINISF